MPCWIYCSSDPLARLLHRRQSRAGFAASAAPAPLPDVDEIYHPSITRPSTVNVGAFVEANFKPYHGDASFLAGPSERTKKLWAQLEDLIHLELQKGASLAIPGPSHIPHHSFLALPFTVALHHSTHLPACSSQ